MESNSFGKSYVLGSILGLIGAAIGGTILALITIKTGTMYGYLSILSGIIAGLLFGLGFKLGKADFKTKAQVSTYLMVAMVFGLLGVIAGYVGIVAYFVNDGLPFALVSQEFDLRDILFLVLGGYGGRLMGKHFLKRLLTEVAEEKVKKEGVENIDAKFKK